MTQETRHTATAVRYLLGTPDGIVEFRAFHTTTTILATRLVHLPDCDAESCTHRCEAEPADGIEFAWLRSGDDGVWAELQAYALGREVDAIDCGIPHEPSAEAREFIARARWAAEYDEN